MSEGREREAGTVREMSEGRACDDFFFGVAREK
jgi:hypothetical protein